MRAKTDPCAHRCGGSFAIPGPVETPMNSNHGAGFWALLAFVDDKGKLTSAIVEVIAWVEGGPALPDADPSLDLEGKVLIDHHCVHESENLEAEGRRLWRSATIIQRQRQHVLDFMQSPPGRLSA